MSRYADWYAVELDGYLRGRMSEVQRFEATREILNHFAEHVDDLVSKGMDPVEAEKAAIVAFGSPRQASINLLGQSKGNVIGKWLILVGCFMITWLTFSMGLVGTLAQIQAYFEAPIWNFYYNNLWRSWEILAVSLIVGTILTRKVPVGKMLIAGGLGIALIGVFFFVGPELNYGNVPKDKFDTMLTKWQAANNTTVLLAELEKSIIESTYTDTFNGKQFVFKDKALAIDRVTHEAPKMLAASSEYIKISGTRFGGYLAPPKLSKSQRWNGEDTGIKQGYNPTETGNSFMVAQRTLQYYDSAEEAINAWAESQKMYGRSHSLFGSIAREQDEFIQGARKFGMLSGPQLLIATILPVILITFASLISMMIIGWPLTKLPTLAVQTSFKRRFA